MAFTALHLSANDLSEIQGFYRRILGMRQCQTEEGPSFRMTEGSCSINFTEVNGAAYRAEKSGFYWKIGLTVRNLKHAVDWLKECNWPVSEPHQFRDIGYLCHLQDPCGYTIELLQQGFEGNEKPVGDGHPIAGQATFAHITLRITDLKAAKAFCEQTLGLHLISVQPVSDLGFSLYFFSFENEMLPDPDLHSVANREWLWRRPYTILELQHLENAEAPVEKPKSGQVGLKGISVTLQYEAVKTVSIRDLAELS